MAHLPPPERSFFCWHNYAQEEYRLERTVAEQDGI